MRKVKDNNERTSAKGLILKRIIISSLCILLGFFIFLFINYGYFIYDKEERGHLFSFFLNLNKFEIDISKENKIACEIFWNKTIIYKNR